MADKRTTQARIRRNIRTFFNDESLTDREIHKFLSDIIYCTSKLKHETEELQMLRLMGILDITNTLEVEDYLNKYPSEYLKEDTLYGRLAEIGVMSGILPRQDYTTDKIKDIPTPEVTPIEQEKETIEQAPITTDSISQSETSASELTINNTNIKEVPKMENTVTRDPLAELEAQANGVSMGDKVEQSNNPVNISSIDRKAIRAALAELEESRKDFSQNSKITKLIITNIDPKDRCVEGVNAKGIIKNPAKALENFKKYTGYDCVNGVSSYTKLCGTTHDQAEQIRQILEAAVENNTVQYDANFTTNDHTAIKGFELKTKDGKTEIHKFSDIANILSTKAYIFLNIDSKTNSQIQLAESTKSNSANPYAVRISSRKQVLEDASVVFDCKVIDKSTVDKDARPMNSKMSVGYLSDKLDVNNKNKKMTWKVPLEIQQYKVVTLEEYKSLFDRAGGQQVENIDLSSKEHLLKISELSNKIIDSVYAKGETKKIRELLGNDVIESIKAKKAEAQRESEEAANKLANQLSNDVNPDDF